jgi:hypothetical protein
MREIASWHYDNEDNVDKGCICDILSEKPTLAQFAELANHSLLYAPFQGIVGQAY